jgi:dTDP-4-dehydrorhamnose reductase
VRRILLTGAAGQVGKELQLTLAPLGDVLPLGHCQLDLTNSTQIAAQVQAFAPTHIINAAAYTAVDKAESEPELAAIINATAPTQLAQLAQSLGADLIHLSTDYVFDGSKGSPYLEDDPTQPLGIYGQTKRDGEVGIRRECDRHWIVRTAWVHGAYGKVNFVKTMLRLGAERPELRVVSDQIGSPTWAGDIAQTLTQFVQESPAYGTYHFTNSGVASWYDFALAIFEEARLLGIPLCVERVVPIPTLAYPTPAQRPAYSVLSGERTAAVLDKTAPHWRQSLRQMLQQLNPLT